MTARIICSWRVLFQKAHAMGQARLRHIANPTPETEQELADLEADHKAYEDLCLRADDMIDTPCLELPSA
ncbi:hypothetical protein MAL1_00186 [Bacteriophage DSS3_MAL1]|nr:hypothetical protein MAL1_00186 [Bacteriophage DSS3_MAL1]